ncbi:hypothetical protein [Archangium primigenium]|uniref:hypothetical protein n=1 Tax=[Archangium] primigenium TaxID=2792470 RepID=UPI001957482F|nr:hypothetical protein [Archangium primigenium]MBM7116830.1 hypothetical protein [Archangium primigenium]
MNLERFEILDNVLDVLAELGFRATYGALARVLGVASGQQVGSILSLRPRDPRHSWVVAKRTGLPTGYVPEQWHPGLFAHEVVIEDPAILASLRPACGEN